jgi:transcriptional regulator with XRE-family HTH domain
MNVVRKIRRTAGVTQQELAGRAGTSQSTIAAYESGKKSPTLRTLDRLASALNLDLRVEVAPPTTRENRRSIAYHRAVLCTLRRDYDTVLERARTNLSKLRSINPDAGELLDRWENWLRLSPDSLERLVLSPDETACDMRQVSPFSGILSPAERAQLLRRFRQEYPA